MMVETVYRTLLPIPPVVATYAGRRHRLNLDRGSADRIGRGGPYRSRPLGASPSGWKGTPEGGLRAVVELVEAVAVVEARARFVVVAHDGNARPRRALRPRAPRPPGAPRGAR